MFSSVRDQPKRLKIFSVWFTFQVFLVLSACRLELREVSLTIHSLLAIKIYLNWRKANVKANLIFVAVQCEHKIGFCMNPSGSDVAFAQCKWTFSRQFSWFVVYAIEASDLAVHTERVVAANRMTDTITVINKRVEVRRNHTPYKTFSR